MLNFPVYLLLCCAITIAIYCIWMLCRLNGIIIVYLIQKLKQLIFRNQKQNSLGALSSTAMILVGLAPMAIASMAPAVLMSCHESQYILLATELCLLAVLCVCPKSFRQQIDVLGLQTITQNRNVFGYVLLWSGIFSFWVVWNSSHGMDYLVVNKNPDMWAYIRRFAGFTTENLSFDGKSACSFVFGSPKKLSSFIGSLFTLMFGKNSFGITVFQGTLGGCLFLCLFWEWLFLPIRTQKKLNVLNCLWIVWAFFSPQIYWLLVSSYLSNTLFIIILGLALRQAWYFANHDQLQTSTQQVILASIILDVFSFYPAFLPVILLPYCIVLIVDAWTKYSQQQQFALLFKTVLTVSGTACVLYALFSSHLGLAEVSSSFNVLDRHGANFVPLNPWSLLQETPKPMPVRRDFGWYINLIISIPLSLYFVWYQCRRLPSSRNQQRFRNHILLISGGIIYCLYLLAYIPLEYTYRLGKIAISLIYPISIFGLLSFSHLINSKLANKTQRIKAVALCCLAVHAGFHVFKTLDLSTYPAGIVSSSGINKYQNQQELTVVGCKDTHISQKYERLVGFQLAGRYPHLSIDVVEQPKNLKTSPRGDRLIFGEVIQDNTKANPVCHFSL